MLSQSGWEGTDSQNKQNLKVFSISEWSVTSRSAYSKCETHLCKRFFFSASLLYNVLFISLKCTSLALLHCSVCVVSLLKLA